MKCTDWFIDSDTHITEPGDVWTTRLPEKFRAVVLLRYYEEHPPREVTRKLDLSMNEYWARMKRAHELLRQDLRGRLELRAVAMSQPSRAVDEGAAKSHAENLAILVERERVVLAARNLHDPAAAEGFHLSRCGRLGRPRPKT